jgi:ATP-binding cassette subfamily B protein
LVWRSSPFLTGTYLGLTAILAAVPWGVAIAAKRIVDAVTMADSSRAFRAVWLEFGLVALQMAASRLLLFAHRLIGSRLGLDVNVAILERAKRLELVDFEDPDTYDRMTKARREASSRPLELLSGGLDLLRNGVTFAGYGWILFGTRPWVALLVVLSTIPSTVFELRHSKEGFKLRSHRSAESRKLNYYEYVLSNDEHAKEVKVFGLGDFFLERYRELGESFFRDDATLLKKRLGTLLPLSLLPTVATYALYGFVAVLAASQRITLGEMTLYVLALRQGQTAFASTLSAIGNVYEHNLYMSNLFAFLDGRESDDAPPQGGEAVPLPGQDLTWTFEDVGFRYPGKDSFAVRHLTLTIAPGERIALVGHNGAGKTTLVKLMLGLYTPTEGRIGLGGKDLREWPRADLHRLFGVVFQDYNQYHLALRENVGVGRLDRLRDDAHIRDALGKGGAEDMSRSLTGGLDAVLGRWFRDGVELSGGQWQRVALSRAFMRTDAPFLILDEPSAALDAQAEHAVFQRFVDLAKGKTTLIISHRFPTVRMADRILVLEAGRIVEEGSHEALLAQGGTYATLFNLQAAGYLN